MNNERYEEVKDFIFGILAYIRPNMNINENTPLGTFELDDIDLTMIAIECEEKYQILVYEKTIANSFFLQELITYIVNLIDEKEKTFYQLDTK